MTKLFQPMLAKLGTGAFDNYGWLFEPKLDGIRAIAYYDGHTVKLINRSLNDVTSRFPELEFNFTVPCVVDGEIVCFGPDGVPDFQRMQCRMNRKVDIAYWATEYPATFVAFDVIEINGIDFINNSLRRRKDYLDSVLNVEQNSYPIDYTTGEGLDTLAKYSNWEGIMAKRLTSKYIPGYRSPDWLKIKQRKYATVYVIGCTEGQGRRANTFGALVVTNTYGETIGEIGTGFTDAQVDQLLDMIKARCTGRLINYYDCSPFAIKASYLEITSNGQMRHPAFEGFINS